MEIGNKILELRKENHLSQEELAEKVGVARQTISKWELGETSPDIKQAKQLSTIFNISLDELTGNDVKEVIIEKVSNTEKLAGIVIKILKVIGILIIISIIFSVISIIAFTTLPQKTSITHEMTKIGIEEYVGDEIYSMEIGTDGTFNCNDMPATMKHEILEIIDFEDLEKTERSIQAYFEHLREEQKSE